jgi:hypothetical protein
MASFKINRYLIRMWIKERKKKKRKKKKKITKNTSRMKKYSKQFMQMSGNNPKLQSFTIEVLL